MATNEIKNGCGSSIEAVLASNQKRRRDYLISTVGLPIISQVDVASAKEPYLGLRLVLDPAVVTSTMVESGFAQRQNDSVKAIAVSKLDFDLLNACLRLLRLLQLPEQYRVLGRSSFVRSSTGFSPASRAIACAT